MNDSRSRMTPIDHLIASKRLVFAVFMVITLGAFQALAQASKPDFKFENVIDTTQGLQKFSQFPALNNRGAIAFVATNDRLQGVFKWERGTVTTVASESDDILTFFGDDVVINIRGVVGYEASFKANLGERAIFTSDGASTKTIVDTSAQGLIARFLGSPSINDLGTVAFAASRKNFSRAIYTGNGEALATVVDTEAGVFSGLSNAAINNAEKIAFVGFLQDGTQQVFIATHSAEIIPVTDKDPILADPFTELGDPVINTAGTIANEAFLGNGDVEVFTGNTTGTTARTDPNSSFLTFSEHPSINNRGAVAFFATDLKGGQGIFVEQTGGASPIALIETGDELFGSTVIGLDLGRFGLNDRDQLAFHYDLQDGRSGIAIVSVHKGEKEEHENDR